MKLPEYAQRHNIGRLRDLEGSLWKGREFVMQLTQVDQDLYAFIPLENGNRWNDPHVLADIEIYDFSLMPVGTVVTLTQRPYGDLQ